MIRPLSLADIAEALAIQVLNYPPDIQDGAAAFASRITLAPDWCWAVETAGRLDAYLLSHPWTAMSPPSVDAVLERAEGEVWYIHDLSVAPWARGRGLGDQLLDMCRVTHPEIERSELVAVPGAAPFWERRGWRPVETAALKAKAQAYGAGSAYLIREWV